MHRMFWKTLRSIIFKCCHSIFCFVFCFVFFPPLPFSAFPNLSVVTGVSDNTKAASVYARTKLLSAPPVSPILCLISAVGRACFDPQISEPTSQTPATPVPQLSLSWHHLGHLKKQKQKTFPVHSLTPLCILVLHIKSISCLLFNLKKQQEKKLFILMCYYVYVWCILWSLEILDRNVWSFWTFKLLWINVFKETFGNT